MSKVVHKQINTKIDGEHVSFTACGQKGNVKKTTLNERVTCKRCQKNFQQTQKLKSS